MLFRSIIFSFVSAFSILFLFCAFITHHPFLCHPITAALLPWVCVCVGVCICMLVRSLVCGCVCLSFYTRPATLKSLISGGISKSFYSNCRIIIKYLPVAVMTVQPLYGIKEVRSSCRVYIMTIRSPLSVWQLMAIPYIPVGLIVLYGKHSTSFILFSITPFFIFLLTHLSKGLIKSYPIL